MERPAVSVVDEVIDDLTFEGDLVVESGPDTSSDDETPIEDRRRCSRIMSDGQQCPEYLPDDVPESRLYCDEHKNGKKKRKTLDGAGDEPLPGSIQPPPRKTVTKKDSDAQKVEAGALAMLAFVPIAWSMVGDEVCPIALNEAIPAIAHQLGELSRFHPQLKRIFAPGEGTGEAFVWISLAIAVSPVIVAILTHHGVIKGDLAQRLNETAKMVSSVANVANG